MEHRPLPEISESNRPYWDAARRHELVLPKCGSCGKFFMPPRAWCPHCFSRDHLTWTPASGQGTVESFSLMYLTPFEDYVETFPYVLATIKLVEGPQLMANIVNSDLNAIRIGSVVKVCFEQRANDVTVPQFELSNGVLRGTPAATATGKG